MGGPTLVWHGLLPSSLLGPKTLTLLLKFDKYSPGFSRQLAVVALLSVAE